MIPNHARTIPFGQRQAFMAGLEHLLDAHFVDVTRGVMQIDEIKDEVEKAHFKMQLPQYMITFMEQTAHGYKTKIYVTKEDYDKASANNPYLRYEKGV